VVTALGVGPARAPLARAFKGVRVAWWKGLGGIPFEPEITRVVNANRKAFEAIGCVVEEAEPDFTGVGEALPILRHLSYHANHATLAREHPDLVKDTIKWEIAEAERNTGPTYPNECLASRDIAHPSMFRVLNASMPPITVDWIHIAALVGALQGFLLAGVLAAHRGNRTANRLLAILMIAFSVYLLSAVYYAVGLQRAWPHFFGVSYPLPWVFGPLVYLYALAASDRARRPWPRDAIHIVPVAAVVIALLPIYLMSGADKVALYDRLRLADAPTVIRVLDPFKYLSGLSYSVATIAVLARHRARVKDSYSNIERVSLRWLLWLAAAAAAIWMLATLVGAAGMVRHPLPGHGDDVVALAIALLVYAIGYMGLRQPEIFLCADLDQRPGEAALPGETAPADAPTRRRPLTRQRPPTSRRRPRGTGGRGSPIARPARSRTCSSPR
jgi:hypothetical protein